jgi:hypothetical protein
MSTPNPDDHSELREALRRDAARMQEPPFDAALHHATIRRIRALADTDAARSVRRWIPAFAAGAALLLVVVVNLTRRESPRAQPDVAAAIASSRNSIARLSVEPPSLFPAWASPTASMLEGPRIPQ